MPIKNIWLRMLTLAAYSDLHTTRFLLGLTEIICAFLLLFVEGTLDYSSYSILQEVMSDKAWAFLFLIMGMTQFSILATGRYHERFPVWFAAVNQSVWWFVVISMLISDTATPPLAMAGYFSLAVGASLIWVRSGHKIGRRHTDG